MNRGLNLTSSTTTPTFATTAWLGEKESQSQGFVGKVVLVTGGGSGIGESVALALGDAGAYVVVNDVNQLRAEAVANAIDNDGGTALAVGGDVSNPQDVRSAVDLAVGHFGALHLAFNNAGIEGPIGPLTDMSIEEYLKVMNVNLHSVFYGLYYEIPEMLKAGGGAIVNTSSILGVVGDPNAAAYVAAKHGIVGLTRSAALCYASQGVRVNSVHPGYIDTPMLENWTTDESEALKMLHPIGRLGTVSEVANLVLFLLSDKASFITGAQYVIDGGYTAQ